MRYQIIFSTFAAVSLTAVHSLPIPSPATTVNEVVDETDGNGVVRNADADGEVRPGEKSIVVEAPSPPSPTGLSSAKKSGIDEAIRPAVLVADEFYSETRASSSSLTL